MLKGSIITGCLLILLFSSCKKSSTANVISPVSPAKVIYDWNKFVMGADLSYINQVQDYGGAYQRLDFS